MKDRNQKTTVYVYDYTRGARRPQETTQIIARLSESVRRLRESNERLAFQCQMLATALVVMIFAAVCWLLA